MDVSIPLLFLVLFLLACFSLFIVYKYGMKEKSFEEALAEQRQQNNALLGPKAKPKEKKNKKASKKSKDKSAHQETDTDALESIENDKENSQPNKLHVEFKEILEDIPTNDESKVSAVKESSKMKKVKKVRPILVRKDKSPEKVMLDIVNTTTVNHFEENHPKDDFELIRSNSKDEIFKVSDPVKEKLTKDKRPATESNASIKNKKNFNKIEPVVDMDFEEKVDKALEVIPISTQTNGTNRGKDKKKKKTDNNARNHLTTEKDELINSVRTAELSKTEVQLLIDLLLNKQLEAPTIISDWSEGKYDPIQKLKKQLAEKEKALIEEQEALMGVQVKLKEIRAEQQAEKAHLQLKIRGLEELAQTRLIEIQAANNRYQVNAQQLQADLSSEKNNTLKLLEEINALQMQIQQYEVSLSQKQDAENVIANLRHDFDEVSSQNQQLRMEIQQIINEKEMQQRNFMIQINNLEKGYKESHQELEKNLEMALRQENDWKNEISHRDSSLQQRFEEKRKLELTLGQLNEQLRMMNNDKIESAKYIAQLTSELQLAKEEIKHLNHSAEDKQIHEVEILNLSNELASKKSELSAKTTEWLQTERKYKADLETTSENYQKLLQELEEQKAKNNDLRAKNWKVMEALNAAESKAKNIVTNKQLELDVEKLSQDIITREQKFQKEFLQRLFPEIEELKTANTADWQVEYERLVKNHLKGLQDRHIQETLATPPTSPHKSHDVSKLQTQLLHYKGIIDDTESMLNNLQKHIEKEEINWRSQLATKEEEIEYLKEVRLSQLQNKVTCLEQQLSIEVSERQRLLKDFQVVDSKKPKLTTPSATDSTATIEKLSEEVNRLRDQLRVEQTKNGDVAVSLKAKTCSNSTNGTFIEHCLSSSSSIASSIMEELNKKPKNKKRKKKGNGELQ